MAAEPRRPPGRRGGRSGWRAPLVGAWLVALAGASSAFAPALWRPAREPGVALRASDRMPKTKFQSRQVNRQQNFHSWSRQQAPRGRAGAPDKGSSRRTGYQARGGPAQGEQFDEISGRTANWAQEVESRYRLWDSVFNESSKWIDLRQVKAAERLDGRIADFEQKETGEQVWADSFFVPMWVSGKLQEADRADARWQVATRRDLQEKLWKQLFDDPDGWLDFRPTKEASMLEASHADFRHEAGGEELSVGDRDMPSWVPERLEEATQGGKWRVPGDAQQKIWQDLFADPGKWLDFREMKAAGEAVPAHPDFLQQWSGEAVWLDVMPPWAAARLEAGDVVWPLAVKQQAPERAPRR